MTVISPARRLSVMFLLAGLCALLSASGCSSRRTATTNATLSTNALTPAPNSTSDNALKPKLVVAGRYDCKTRAVEVTDGVFEHRQFESLTALSSALAEKGYNRTALEEITTLKVCELNEDDFRRLTSQAHEAVTTADERPSLLLKS